MSIALEQLIQEAAARFDRAGIPDPKKEAERIAKVALNMTAKQAAALKQVDEAPVTAEFVDFVRRRSARVPLERLLGSVRFRDIELLIGDGAFVPQPETEPVVAWSVEALAKEAIPEPRIVDLCTGSGAIALAMANEVPHGEVHAVEIDPDAHGWARRNAERRAAAGDRPITLHLGDIKDALHELDGSFDLVVSNPPYVADHELANLHPEVRDHDPRVAIQGGPDGLDLVRLVERVAFRLLKKGGLLVIEHSDRQGASAPAVLKRAGCWTEVMDHVDQEGRDRFVTARFGPAPKRPRR